jgi:hypothetical protein
MTPDCKALELRGRAPAHDDLPQAAAELAALDEAECPADARRVGPDAAKWHVGRRAGALHRHVDNDIELRRGQRAAAPWRVHHVADRRQRQAAGQLVGRAPAQHDADVLTAGQCERRAETLADG